MATEVILSGNEETLKPIITQLIAMRQLLEDREIGQFMGYPIEDYVRRVPPTIKLNIVWFSLREPPFTQKYSRGKLIKVNYNIPDVKRALMKWKIIKEACGGNNGFLWGRFRTTANLSNGRQMQVYGASEKESREQLIRLVALSNAEIATITTAEEKREGRRAKDKWMYKESTRVYPAFFSIINTQKIINASNRNLLAPKPNEIREGTQKRRSLLSGDYIQYGSTRIPLWIGKEPSTARRLIEAAFSRDNDFV